MIRQQTITAARGLTDHRDWLLSADAPLAELQEGCGGTVPGVLAVPELLGLVRHARSVGLRIAREFSAFDGEDTVSAFVRIHPIDDQDGGGCELLIENWQRSPVPPENSQMMAERLDDIDRAAAEVVARLDDRQQVQILSVTAKDGAELREEVRTHPGKIWSEYVDLQGIAHQQPLHWRLLDGTMCRFEGSARQWQARLIPLGSSGAAPRGFELLLIADEPLAADTAAQEEGDQNAHARLIGSTLTPALRQPIARIIANAETIRSRLAGPLKEEYSEYAGSISAAGQHLSSMLDDLADLEVVEAPGFTTAKDDVDLADAARRAAGILGVRAQDREIAVALEEPEEEIIATGEFRRVLQILINLIGNAIAYSPEGSTVTIITQRAFDGTPQIRVCDEGPGVTPEQARRIFAKFERLGRDKDGSHDGGSGLGLYISRRLALAMGGNLEVVKAEAGKTHPQGAEFVLSLPRAQ